MFSALRTNGTLYVLDKKEEPRLRVARVVSVTAPQPKFNPQFSLTPETTVDVNVKFDDGSSMEFKQLPSNLSVASFDGGNTTITETKESMLQEVETLLRNSKAIVESVHYHEKVIDYCEDMMRELNPQLAKEKETDERLGKLEVGLCDIKDMLAKVLNTAAEHKPF